MVQAEAMEAQEAVKAAQEKSEFFGEDRKKFLGGAAEAVGYEYPTYLDGRLAGDAGFDPLRLGEDPERLGNAILGVSFMSMQG